MFIRSKRVGDKTYFQVVKGERRGGKVRQVVVLSLGTSPTLADAMKAASRKMRDYQARLDAEPDRDSEAARRYARVVEEQRAFIDKLWALDMDGPAPDDSPGSGTTQDDPVVPEEEEEIGWFAYLKVKAAVASWPDAERYVYREFGPIGEPNIWTAHGIVSQNPLFIVYTRDGCPLFEIERKGPGVLKQATFFESYLEVANTSHIVAHGSYGDQFARVHVIDDRVLKAHAEEKPRWSSWTADWGAWTAGKSNSSDYAVLGIRPGASAAEVKDAYRRKAKATHPDRGGSPEAFRVVQEAYDRLSKVVA
jgi:hypothetical protein